jgi:hypothetical protein
MREALASADLDAIQAKVEALAPEHPELARAIIERCQAFDFEGLEDFLHPQSD